MYLTELVLQGIRGFSAPRKLTIGPGFNVVLGAKGAGKTTIAEVLGTLLYPVSFDKATIRFQENPPSPNFRAGIGFHFQGDNYRKVADLSQGVVSLSRFNKQNSSFENLSQDQTKIHEFFTQDLKLPDSSVYRILFCSWPEEFPSNKASKNISMPGFQSDFQQNPEALKQEIQNLRKLREDALKIKQMQFDLDGCHKQIFEMVDVLKKSQAIQEQLDQCEKEISQIGNVAEMPPDLDSRCEKYEVARKKLNRELPQLQQSLNEMNEEMVFNQELPLQKDSNFLSGSVMLIVSVLTAVSTAGQDQVLNVPIQTFHIILGLLALMGLALVSYRLFYFFSSKDRSSHLSKEITKVEDKIKALERKFEIETTIVRNIMRALDVDTVDGLKSSLERLITAKDRKKELESRLQAERTKPQHQKAEKNLPIMKQKARSMEKELQLLSGAPLDADALDQQIWELEQQAQKSGIDITVSQEKPRENWLKEIPEDFIDKTGRDFFYDPAFKLIMVAANSFQFPAQDFVDKLVPPLDKNLSAFSFNNMSESHIDLAGTYSVHDQEAKSRIRFEQLETFKQDLAYFALKFTILQFVLQQNPVPLIFDSAFRSFDERIASAIAKSLKFLSEQTQIIMLTDQEYYAQTADHVQKL